MRPSALEYIENKFMRKDVTDFRTGDTVRVHWRVKEGEKERVQPFEGIVIRKTKGQNRATFTVRKISYGVGVERIFPLHSPRYERIEVLNRGDVNRNRLFYLRDLKGKASRVDTQEQEQELTVESASQAPAGIAEGATAPAEAPVGDPNAPVEPKKSRAEKAAEKKAAKAEKRSAEKTAEKKKAEKK